MTWPAPDSAVARRVRDAHAYARAVLGVRADHGARPAWGWQGRSLGMPVTTATGRPMWLRVATRPGSNGASAPKDIFWTGAVEAHHHIPASVPRPQLRRWHTWTDTHTDAVWCYRAELYDRAPAMISTDPAVTSPPALPDVWWVELRVALDTVAAVPTTRRAVHPGFLRWAAQHYLSISLTPPDETSWNTVHGDLHFANLTGPRLQIIDWEGWGRAPLGYDAAMLHLHSLPAPDTAARVRRELAHLLDSDTGRHTELLAIAELLHSNAYGAGRVLTDRLRDRAVQLGRQLQLIPSPP